MTTPRVRLAARIAAVEAFREERERQQLAAARHAARAAEAAADEAEHAWRDIEARRTDALAVRHDLARYLTWGELAAQASRLHEHLSRDASLAEAKALERAREWATVKARADATDDRSQRMSDDEANETETRQDIERMDMWMNRRGDLA